MVNEPHVHIELPDRTYQAMARSAVKKIAVEIGFEKNRLAQFEIITAEITSNLSKHTKSGGQLLVKKLADKENPGIEIISIDAGPGMEIPKKMLEDGVSTSRTLGQGLGAIKRLSDEFDLYSIKDWGTILLSRFYLKVPQKKKQDIVDCKIVMLSKDKEKVCGDGWDAIIKGSKVKFIIADGLGHGAGAHEATQQAIESFRKHSKLQPDELLREIHTDIKKTRGAVINISYIDFKNKQIAYSGVGNISSKIISYSKTKSCVSYNGIVGHTIPNSLNTHTYPYELSDMLILNSDGISGRWDIQKYPFITKHDGSIIAAALYKDFTRKTDDVSVAVIRYVNDTNDN